MKTALHTTLIPTTTTEVVGRPAILAPQLGRVVDAWLALKQNPSDRRAQITLKLLEKQGATDCGTCGEALSLHGYRSTRTSYAVRTEVSCGACRARFLVDDELIA
jgi:hypothetical protein